MSMPAPDSNPALNPYDTGRRCEAKPWIPYGTKVSAALPAENFGKVDFDDDEGHTIVTVHVERTDTGTHRVVVTMLDDEDSIEICTQN